MKDKIVADEKQQIDLASRDIQEQIKNGTFPSFTKEFNDNIDDVYALKVDFITNKGIKQSLLIPKKYRSFDEIMRGAKQFIDENLS